MSDQSILSKNTTRYPQVWLQPGLVDLEVSALTMRPVRLYDDGTDFATQIVKVVKYRTKLHYYLFYFSFFYFTFFYFEGPLKTITTSCSLINNSIILYLPLPSLNSDFIPTWRMSVSKRTPVFLQTNLSTKRKKKHLKIPLPII